MSRLNRSLEELASRGHPRGADKILAAATNSSTPSVSPTRRRTPPWVAFAGTAVLVLVIGIGLNLLIGPPADSPPALPPFESPTTTLWVESTLPPAMSSPTPTVPAGSDLEWYDFMHNIVQLAWRETDAGAEMCWRTAVDEGCVDDDFTGPEVVVVPLPHSQVAVITRRALGDGPGFERAIVELSNGQTIEAGFFSRSDGTSLLVAIPERLPSNTTVIAARADNWPIPPCVMPPASQVSDSVSALNMTVTPSTVVARQEAELRILDEGAVGSVARWQCWDGSEWIDTDMLIKATEDANHGPTTHRRESPIEIIGVDLPVPDVFRVRIPDLPPGIYRIADRLLGDTSQEGWVMVEIVDPR